MVANFKIGDNLVIVDGPNESNIGKEVVVIDTFNFVRNTKVSAVNVWEYRAKDEQKSILWVREYYLAPLNKP